MSKLLGPCVVLIVFAFPARAADPQLICFGNEPSWSVQFFGSDSAQLSLPDEKPTMYQGGETRHDPLTDRIWRGKPEAGQSGSQTGDLVAFLSATACSDGMSDTQHPMTARVSLSDGRFLAGCCRVPGSTETAVPIAIEGPTWRLTNLPGLDAKVLQTSPRPVTARFEAGRINGFSGCNNYMGGYTIDHGRVTIGPLAGTMMMCDPNPMTIENAVHAALTGALRYTIAGDRLTLTAASGTTIDFQAEPPPTLEGVTWDVTGFNNGRSAVVGPIVGTTLTLSFADGTVQGSAGCNTFRATYTSKGDHLDIGPAITTRMACPGDGVMQQEQQFLTALSTATTWTLQGGMLDVHRADGERVLSANPHPK